MASPQRWQRAALYLHTALSLGCVHGHVSLGEAAHAVEAVVLVQEGDAVQAGVAQRAPGVQQCDIVWHSVTRVTCRHLKQAGCQAESSALTILSLMASPQWRHRSSPASQHSGHWWPPWHQHHVQSSQCQCAGGHLLGVVGPAEHGPAAGAGEAGLVVELAADQEAALQDPLPAHTAALQRHLAGGWVM